MKNLILLLTALLSSSVFAGSFSLATTAATERINDRLDVTLFEVKGQYRFDNGLLAGAVLQKGFPENNGTIETRSEVLAGYSDKFSSFMPYAIVALGNKTKSSGDRSVAYTSATVGTIIVLNKNWFTDVQYRYRDSIDNSWRTERLQGSIGYNISKQTAVALSYGKSSGNFKSDAYSLTTLFRF